MAKDVKFLISANVDRAEAEIRKLKQTGNDVSDSLAGSFNQLGVKSTLAVDNQRAAYVAAYDRIKTSGVTTWKEIQDAHAGMSTKIAALDKVNNFDKSSAGAKDYIGHIDNLGSSIDRLTGRFTALVTGMAAMYVGSKLWQGFQAGIEAVDNFQMTVAQTAATITSLQGGDNIAENYRSAKEYAEGLQTTLMQVDANTSLNLSNLQTITFEMVKQGVVLDTNNAAQVEGFTRLANAVAVYSRNGRDEMQVRQEVAALMRGEVDQNSQLAGMIQKTVDGPLKEQIDKWKQSGTLMEELGNRLVGFGEASKDIAQQWSSVKSSFETATTVILQAAFPSIVKDISEWLKKINDYLKEHKNEIAGEIKSGWETVKGFMATAADIAKAIYNNFEPFAAFFIGGLLLKGITGAVTMMKTLRDVAIATRAVLLATGALSAGTGVAAAAGSAAAGGAAVAGGGMLAATGGLLAAFAPVAVALGGAALIYSSIKSKAVNNVDELSMINKSNKITDGTNNPKYKWLISEGGMTPQQAIDSMGSVKSAIPVINPKETEAQIKERLELQEKELAAFKATQDQKTAYTKAASDIDLTNLKQFYDEGRITTKEYYEEENRIALEAAESRYSDDVDYYNKEVDLLNSVLTAKGEKSKEYQEELAKNIKADQAVTLSDMAREKTVIEGETKVQEAVRSTAAAYASLLAKSQEEAGQYVSAAETKIEAERKTAEYLRMSAESRTLKEQEFSIQRIEAQNKEADAIRTMAADTRTLQDEVDALNGKTQAMTSLEKDLLKGKENLNTLQRNLNLAIANGNTAAINGLTAQITLQNQLNDSKTSSVELEQSVAVLKGEIVGFSNGQPIYAKDATAGQYQYQSAAQIAAGSSLNNTSSLNFTSANAFPSTINSPFLGGFAVGTNRVPADGYAYLHKDEAVVPAKYNPAVGGAGTGITIQGGITFTLPNVTNQSTADDLARMIMPALEKLTRRQAA